MLTLFSYPDLFGVADNNPFGLKVFAFLKLCDLPFAHRHVLDASAAPRAQLPYLDDDGHAIGDSDAIVSHLIRRFSLTIDSDLTEGQRDMALLIGRLLDDLYWVMSYSRWKDDRFWPQFCDALVTTHPDIPASALEAAREYNSKRYWFQGIGRYEPDAVYARGIASLRVLAHILPPTGFVFGSKPCSTDAAIYGFIANIHFYAIDTPLKEFVLSRQNLVAHCEAIHARVA